MFARVCRDVVDVAFGLGLAAHPRSPRRWAVGAYMDAGGDPVSRRFGEMHVRAGHYIGIAPVPAGLTNVCVVTPWRAGDAPLGDPRDVIVMALAGDRLLRDRFADARMATTPVVLGPLAVDACERSVDSASLRSLKTSF